MFKKIIINFFLFTFLISAIVWAATNISDSKKYAWGEGTGWIDFNTDGGNVMVENSRLTGYIWSDNFGWINLNPDKSGVKNNGYGDLYGYAWGENLGWINFDNVKIDMDSGLFSGTAETENNGKIVFNSESNNKIAVKTTWSHSQENNCKDHSLHGNAWSDGIGWISFDCKSAKSNIDYGVDVDRNGNLSGFAWSDAIGWIDFSYYEGGSDAARYNRNSHKLEGYAKALSGLDDTDDDFTGTISLQGNTKKGDAYAPIYNPSTYEFDDFAWGGQNVIGWIDFKTDYSVVTMDPFYFRFYSNHGDPDDPVPEGQSVILTWETAGANSCTASDGGSTSWTDNNPKVVGEPSAASETISNLNSDTKFVLTCEDDAGNSLSKEVNVKVAPPPPSIFVSVDDDNIALNSSTTIHYNIKAVKDCRLTSSTGRDEAVDSSDGVHDISTGNLSDSTNWFQITCDAADQTYYPNKQVSGTVYVDVERLEVEFYPESNPVRFLGTIKLYWQTEFANSCTATSSCLVGCSANPENDLGFSGDKTTEAGLHEWIKPTKEEKEGRKYKVRFECVGNENQKDAKEIIIQVGRNPIFGEI